MANKASKSLARQNSATLNRTHLTTLCIHLIFILYRLLFRRGSITKYILLSLPSLVIEFYLERLGRPVYRGTEMIKPGEDLAAKGLTEYLWDIVYSTWIVLGLVAVVGEWAWWAGLIVPAYAMYLAWGLYKGFMGGQMPGMPQMGAQEEQQGEKSKRQAKMEGRGDRGGKVRYR
ncbi:hypothetical protein BZA77DRAFT_276162 [Pyronema omphalodes]|nr:hypothetical protein BZA77DRAFT_276162 [Pyronema omphalodes]